MAGQTEAAGLPRTAYPLVCPLNGQGRALLLCCAVPGLTGIFLPWAFWGVGGLGPKLLMLSGAAVAVGMAVWLLRTALFANLILDRDSITCHYLWSWRLDMGEITGVRGLGRKGGNVILIKNDVKHTRCFIPAGLCGNGALTEWLRSRPDLDTAAQERWRAVLFADSDLPPVIAERLAHARRGWGRSAATAVALTLVVFLLVPIPLPRLFLLAELPILTLVMVYQSRGLVGFELRRDGRGKLQWALVILPSAALVSWAVRLPVHLLHGYQAWLAGAVAGLTLGATAMKADQKTPAPARYGALVIIAPFMWVSAFAGLSLFDIFADRGSPVGHFTALVNDHHPPDHNNAGPTLSLGPWGPVPVPTQGVGGAGGL